MLELPISVDKKRYAQACISQALGRIGTHVHDISDLDELTYRHVDAVRLSS